MRIRLILGLALVLATAALASAQGEPPTEPAGVPLAHEPNHMIAAEYIPVELTPIGNPFVPHAPNDLPAEDLCTEAATLNPPDGGQTITNDMTESAGDPVLACLWGNPSRPQGYRSVWYQFTPQQSGVVTIDTVGSSYDTALAVYDGDCASLNQLACNDDANGFASQVTVNVLAGRTYFVEAADWHAGVSGSAVLDLAAVLEVSTNWEIVGLMDVPRSRHEAIAIGNLLYVFAGQTVLGGNPVRTPRTDVYNAGSQTWTELAPMPAGVTPDGGGGYSNTTAAHLGGKVYFPSGYIGVDTVYDGTHWAYDIAQNVWHTNPPNDLWPTPTIYGTAVPYPQPLDPRYYYLGGLSGPLPLLGGEEPWAPHAEVYIYRPEGPLPWTAGPPMGTARFAHTAGRVPLNGSDHICVVGGISQSGVGDAILLSGGECYSLASESWDISLGALNYPRYNAGSALDVQGNWYIFGGTNAAGASVAVTELYDRASNSWVPLDVRYDLGTDITIDPSRPARGWPRGGFAGDYLWAIGGHRDTAGGDNVLNLVERLFLPSRHDFGPIIAYDDPSGEPDDTLDEARGLPLNLTVSGSFYGPEDYIDVYFFDVPSPRQLTISLTNIPVGSDYNFRLYNSNKLWRATSDNIGHNDEVLPFELAAGRFYIFVERVFPPVGSDPQTQPYHIWVAG